MASPTHLGMEPNFGYSTQTIYDQMRYFDPYRLPDYENAPQALIGHIFMSRPSLNLSDSNIERLRSSTKMAAFFNDPVARSALITLSTKSSSGWLPLVYKKAKSYTVNDIEISAADKGGTFFGHTIKYGFHSEDSKFGGTLSIDFHNDKDHSILWMMYIWMMYIYLITFDRNFLPTTEYMKKGILDYPASIYYIVTDRSGKRIKYIEKIVGVFPTKAPMSIFSWDNDMITQETVTIDFNYGFRSDPWDFSIFTDFMYVSGLAEDNGTPEYTKDDYEEIFHNTGADNEFVRVDNPMSTPIIYRLDKKGTASTRIGDDFYLGWSKTIGNGYKVTSTGTAPIDGLPNKELQDSD